MPRPTLVPFDSAEKCCPDAPFDITVGRGYWWWMDRPTMRRLAWVGGIGVTNMVTAAVVAGQVVQQAAGDGWGVLVPCAMVATLGLSWGGLWWATRRRARLRTGVAIGLAVGVLAHPAMWYLALLVGFVSGTRGSLGEPGLTPVEGLMAMWLYAGVSLLLSGWLTCPISAAICGAGLALYGRMTPP